MSLPADEIEAERLNHQHRGHKAVQGGKNYLAPVDEHLNVVNTAYTPRVLDVGTGSGIWAIEIAREFPQVHVTGIDLALFQPKKGLPENVSFDVGDVQVRLPYPDNHFDVVHTRTLAYAIKDWPSVVGEIVRVTRTGGLVCFAETALPLPLEGVPEHLQEQVAPGFSRFLACLVKSFAVQGYDPNAGSKTIPSLLRHHAKVASVGTAYRIVPWWAWSDGPYSTYCELILTRRSDPQLKEAGDIMLPDAREVPETLRRLVTKSCEMSDEDYADIKEGWIKDLANPDAHSRLNTQHRALKTVNDQKNYIAPLDAVLCDTSEERRVLDIGTGTGIWAIEMALEFPHAEVIGVDLAPVKPYDNLPENVHFMIEDAAQGLPFADNSFDVVHSRALFLGIRDWPAYVTEIVRLVKPGGLVYFVEGAFPFPVRYCPQSQWQFVAPGFLALTTELERACNLRGYDTSAGSVTIAGLLDAHPLMDIEGNQTCALPFWPWSENGAEKEAGQVMSAADHTGLTVILSRIMLADAQEIPDTLRLFIMDTCGISGRAFDQIKKDWLKDLGVKGANTAVQSCHIWARKLPRAEEDN
ncbi:hypothetical protein P7C73_g4385, partial [Tremellales sp. Uapishka_1]